MPAPLKLKDRYEIRETLGQGGMGVVYRAYDSVVKREVAVKTLRDTPSRASLQLFFKECDVMAAMSHPNIVEIFDIGEFQEAGASKPFFVMPLLRGVSLDKLIRTSSHRLTVDRAVNIIAQACRGLQAAHERGLIHRDLKPSNLFVLEDDSVKIIDFGLAHMVDSRSSTGQKGTFLYMAPEQIEMKPLSPQTDIFALGVTAYEALTRRLPFERSSVAETAQAILRQSPPPASELNPAVNQLLGRVVHKAMAKQPWHRFSSAKEFAESLEKALRNEPIDAFDPARFQPRIDRAAKAFEEHDYQYASEILAELEAEGHIDPVMSRLRRQIDQAARRKTVQQLLDSARTRLEQEEYPMALQKIEEVLQLERDNADALSLKNAIESRRSRRQIDEWIRLARQHIENYSFDHARQALHNVLQQSSKDNLALELLGEVDRREQAYARERQEKEKLYQDALDAYHKGEFSSALNMLQRVLELDRRAPDVSSRESGAGYQNLYNQVSSEHDAINSAYAEARRRLGERDFAKAMAVCDEYLAKYPGHALFQALKFDVEEQQRQQLSAYIAEVDRRVEAEPDLEKRVSILQEAASLYPEESHFERALRLMRDKRDLVNSILAKARLQEERGQFQEALAQLEILRSVYGQQPGLEFEIERVQKRRDQQLREQAKARWVEQIDQCIASGDYARAADLLESTTAEFPADAELAELEKVVQQAMEVRQQAQKLLAEGQALCGAQRYEEGLELLRRAHLMDLNSPICRGVLLSALLERARGLIDSDWHAAEPLVAQAVELEPANALARSLTTLIDDRRREESVEQYVSRARQLQANGDLQAALALVEQGLASFPQALRLIQLRTTLNKLLDDARLTQSRLSGLASQRATRALEDTAVPPAAATETAYVPPVQTPPPPPSAAEETRYLTVASAGEEAPPSVSAVSVPAAPVPAESPVVPKIPERGGRKSPLRWLLGIAAVVVLAVAAGLYFWMRPGRSVQEQAAATSPAAAPVAEQPAAETAPEPAPLPEPAATPPASAPSKPISTAPKPPAAAPPKTQPVTSVVTAKVEPVPVEQAAPAKPAPVETKPEAVRPQAGMDGWENPGAWGRTGDWWVRQGGEFVPYRITPTTGTFVFSARVYKGKRLQWFLRYLDPKSHVLFQMDKKNFYRKLVGGGKTTELAKTPHGLPEKDDVEVTIQIDIRNESIVHYIRKGNEWVSIDTWNVPGGDLDKGRFGFFIPGRDQYGLLHFNFYGK